MQRMNHMKSCFDFKGRALYKDKTVMLKSLLIFTEQVPIGSNKKTRTQPQLASTPQLATGLLYTDLFLGNRPEELQLFSTQYLSVSELDKLFSLFFFQNLR